MEGKMCMSKYNNCRVSHKNQWNKTDKWHFHVLSNRLTLVKLWTNKVSSDEGGSRNVQMSKCPGMS